MEWPSTSPHQDTIPGRVSGVGGAQASGCATNEDEDDATTIAAVTASINAFCPHLMVPQDAVEKVEGFIKQLAADRVVVIVRGGGLCFIDFD